MEKYSAWRDKETGIHPFFHPKPTVSRIMFRGVFDFFLALIRFILLLIVFPCYFLVGTVCELLPFSGILKRTILRSVHCIGCRVLLYILGFWHIPTNYQRLSRKHALPKIWPPGLNIASGDLIISNKLSYIEILYLGFRFSPVFTAINKEGDKVKQITLFRALFDSMNLRKVYKTDSSFESLQTLLYRASQKHSGPVVLFPEGANSNGKALLQMCTAMKNVDIDRLRTHVIGFKFYWHYFCPTYTIGSIYYHLYQLCGQVKNTLIVRYLSPNDVPPNPNAGEGEIIDCDWDEQVFQTLANALRLKRTKLTPQDAQDFLDYYDQANKKSYTKIK